MAFKNTNPKTPATNEESKIINLALLITASLSKANKVIKIENSKIFIGNQDGIEIIQEYEGSLLYSMKENKFEEAYELEFTQEEYDKRCNY